MIKLVMMKKKKYQVYDRKKRKGRAVVKAASMLLTLIIAGGSITEVRAAEGQKEEAIQAEAAAQKKEDVQSEEIVPEETGQDEAESTANQTVTYIYHKHIGSEDVSGGCYQTPVYHVHKGNEAEGGSCYETPVYHVHSGDETAGGICYGTIVYHGHSGSSTEGGGCFKPVYHQHSDSCYRKVSSGEYGCYTVKTEDTTDGDYEGHDYKYYHMSCGQVVHGTNSSHNHLELDCSRGNQVTGYALGCGKTEESIDGYLFDCEKTEESIDSYALSCTRTEQDIDGYERSCGKEENAPYGKILLTEEKTDGGKKSLLRAEFEDLTGGEILISENPYTWLNEKGDMLGDGKELLVEDNGTYCVVLGVENEDINKDSLRAAIGVQGIKKPVPVSPEGPDEGETEHGGEDGSKDKEENSGQEEETVNPTPVPTASPVPVPTPVPVTEVQAVPYLTEKKNKSAENEKEQKESPTPVLKKQIIAVTPLPRNSQSKVLPPVKYAEEKTGIFASPAVKMITLTAGIFSLTAGLAALFFLLRRSVAVYNDDGKGGMHYLGRCMVQSEEESDIVTITDAMEEKALTNRYCIRPGLYRFFRKEGEELTVERGQKRISAKLQKEMIVVF